MSITQKNISTSRSVEDCSLHPNYKNDYDLANNFSDQLIYGIPLELDGNEYHKKESPTKLLDTYSKYDSYNSGFSIKSKLRSIKFTSKNYRDYEFWQNILDRQNPLDEFNNTIDKAKYILDLDYGWDEGEAKKIDPLLFNSACKCISNYIEAIYTEKFFIIQSPEISPLSDGSLDFSWQLESARMLINFRMENAEVHAYFYGDLQHNKIPIKGNVPAKEIYEHLMKWMQYLK